MHQSALEVFAMCMVPLWMKIEYLHFAPSYIQESTVPPIVSRKSVIPKLIWFQQPWFEIVNTFGWSVWYCCAMSILHVLHTCQASEMYRTDNTAYPDDPTHLPWTWWKMDTLWICVYNFQSTREESLLLALCYYHLWFLKRHTIQTVETVVLFVVLDTWHLTRFVWLWDEIWRCIQHG